MSLPRLDVTGLLRRHGLTPKKGLGQNFLMDESALREIVSASQIPTGAEVLEVGPGLGSLTRHLALVAQRVVAVELDKALLPALAEVLRDFPRVEVVQGDILELNPADLMRQAGYLVVANIPYYITSALIRHLLEAPLKPSRMVLTVQREVAERICARPGEMSLLALSVQVYGEARVVGRIPAGAFYPAPAVDSSVVRIDLLDEPVISAPQLDVFFALIRAGFSQRRKTLRNSLAAGMGWPVEKASGLLAQAGVDPKRRAETVSLAEWRAMTQALFTTDELILGV